MISFSQPNPPPPCLVGPGADCRSNWWGGAPTAKHLETLPALAMEGQSPHQEHPFPYLPAPFTYTHLPPNHGVPAICCDGWFWGEGPTFHHRVVHPVKASVCPSRSPPAFLRIGATLTVIKSKTPSHNDQPERQEFGSKTPCHSHSFCMGGSAFPYIDSLQFC